MENSQLLDSLPLPKMEESTTEYFQRWHESVAPSGIYGINIPSQYGGLGLGHWDRFCAIAEMSMVNPSAGAILQSVTLGVGLFLSAPNDIRDEWLPQLADGRQVASICITEPISGARMGNMETKITAFNEADRYVLSGEKQFIANSHVATVHGVIAVADSIPKHNHRHIAVIVPAAKKGVSCGCHDDLDGLRHFNVGTLRFDEVLLDRCNLLVGENGMTLGHRSITLFGKLNLAAVAFGALKASSQATLEYLESTIGKQKDLATVPAIKQRLGLVQMKISQAEALCMRAAQSIDRGEPDAGAILAAKAGTIDLAIQGILDCISIMGARGGSTAAGHVRRLADVIQTLAPAGSESVNIYQLGQVAMGTYKKVGSYDA